MKRIAIIPARAGSKGLPDKNILPLCGKPLLCHTVEAALDSGLFAQVVVSTDSPHYGEIATAAGAQVAIRPAHLATDTATTYAVLADLLTGLELDYFALLQPTSPLRTATHIREAVALFESRFDSVDSLVSVCPAPFPPSLVKPVGEDLSLAAFDEDYAAYRRQSQRYYSPNGAIYLAKPTAYLAKKHFFGQRAVAYLMTAEASVDIDSALDMELARLLMEKDR